MLLAHDCKRHRSCGRAADATGDVDWWLVLVDETDDRGWIESAELEPLTIEPKPTAAP